MTGGERFLSISRDLGIGRLVGIDVCNGNGRELIYIIRVARNRTTVLRV